MWLFLINFKIHHRADNGLQAVGHNKGMNIRIPMRLQSYDWKLLDKGYTSVTSCITTISVIVGKSRQDTVRNKERRWECKVRDVIK